jgi:lipoprotein-releasing system permease protein
MLKLFLWLKYLGSRRIILLSIAAVAISVSLLIVVASIFSGYIAALEWYAVDMMGDVVLEAPDGLKLQKYPAFLEQLEQSGIVDTAAATLYSEGLLHIGKGNVRPVTILGIDPGRTTRVTGLKAHLLRQGQIADEPSFAVPGAPDKAGGFVGIGVVAQPDDQTDEYDQPAILKEMIGQPVMVTTGTIDVTEGGERIPKRRNISFRIADVVFTGVNDFDTAFVYLPLETLQKELYPGKTEAMATRISVKLKPGVDAEAAVAQIRGLWSVYATKELGWNSYLATGTPVETARQMQSRYVEAIRQQMGILLVIFGVISFSVVVLVFCIFYMMVKLKQKDVAIVKSCGAASSSVVGLFVGFGASVGVAGAGIGAALGYVITRNINTVEEWIRIASGQKLWKSSVYMFSRIPNEVDWGAALPIVALAIAAAALGALIPALVAARTRPVEVLRYE